MIAYTFYEIDTRVRRYAEALVKRGDRVDVIALRRKGQKKYGVLKGVNIYRIKQRNYDERSIFSYIFKIVTFFIMGSIFLLARYRRYRYQIIHIHNVPDFLIFMGLIPELLGSRLILDIHDVLPEFYCQKFNKDFDSYAAKLLLLVEKISARFADHVIVANDLWRQKIIQRDAVPPERCTTLLNYPILEFFSIPRYQSSHDDFKLIYPGTISHHHGVDVAIRALAIVKKSIPSVRLNIYTLSKNVSYYASVQKLIKKLGLEENISFFDPVPSEELGEILSKADVGIVPKRGGIFADEAFSTKILEFMAAGLPIIASKTKVDKYYFDDSMIMFFEPENHEELARCIIELYENPKKRQSLVNHAKQFIVKNNWDSHKQVYYKIITNLNQ